jgi:organic hydroperoxide reductase OsmC/OhrA
MSEYTATVSWHRASHEDYVDNQYSRAHEWHFDGGITVAASSSPQVVPVPYSEEACVDPEEAFVAALSSCHMLFFLANAAKLKFIVDEYVDKAVGVMEQDSEGKTSITKVILRPNVVFSGTNRPTLEQLEEMHHQSHAQCFIANSVKTKVLTEIIG